MIAIPIARSAGLLSILSLGLSRNFSRFSSIFKALPIFFVRGYRRRKKQQRKRRAESDEECIEEMFSHVGTEQEDNGYHVV